MSGAGPVPANQLNEVTGAKGGQLMVRCFMEGMSVKEKITQGSCFLLTGALGWMSPELPSFWGSLTQHILDTYL